jgi:hypothetical protein
MQGERQVICRVRGGIGNQLFCYAAARRLAMVNNFELVIDDTGGFANDRRYGRAYQLWHFCIPCRVATRGERMEPFSTVRRYLEVARNVWLKFEDRNYILQDGLDFDKRLLEIQPRKTVYLDGYWQSELYFKDCEPTIRSDLQFIPPTDLSNQLMAGRIRSTVSVAVHVRFFAPPWSNVAHNASRDYYCRAIEQIESTVKDAHYFIFSDQPSAARALIPLGDDRVTWIAHNRGDRTAYADLWLMAQCQHFIIANSTFSWWGAWLSEHKEKRIVCPGFVLRGGVTAWNFSGQIPSEWIKI